MIFFSYNGLFTKGLMNVNAMNEWMNEWMMLSFAYSLQI